MVKLSNILISIAFVSVILVGFSLFITAGYNAYTPATYNNTSIEKLKTINEEITNITNQTQNKINKLQSNTNIINILDLAVTQTFDAARITAKSVDAVSQISFESQRYTSGILGGLNNTLYSVLGTAVLIIIVVALLMQFFIKSERL